jgi:hypothetical protein
MQDGEQDSSIKSMQEVEASTLEIRIAQGIDVSSSSKELLVLVSLCWGVTRKIRMDPRTRVREREFLARSSTQLESREGVILPVDCTSSKKS